MKRSLKVVALLGGLAMSACSSGTAPEVVPRADPAPIRQGSGAPPLETYVVQFTAVKGQEKEVEVKYAPPGGEPEDFLDIEIEEEGLYRHPDGRLIQDGESVDITVMIDPETFLFTVSPVGLEFHPDYPMHIEVEYDNADPDYDDDGDEDEDDESIGTDGLRFFREDAPAQWTPLATTNDSGGRRLSARSKVLKNIAVSW